MERLHRPHYSLVVGGVIGWLASLVMRTDGQQGVVLNVVVSVVGALLAGFVLIRRSAAATSWPAI